MSKCLTGTQIRAALPITILISPNILLDDQGNLIRQQVGVICGHDVAETAPPGYGDHMLDQLYDHLPVARFQSAPRQSDAGSPFHPLSRTESVQNLTHAPGIHHGAAPAALSSRIQDMTAVNVTSTTSLHSSLINDLSHNNNSILSREPLQIVNAEDEDASESDRASDHHTPERIDCPILCDLSRVPSYSTAVQSSARHLHMTPGDAPPAYTAEVNGSASPSQNPSQDESIPTSASATGMVQEAASTRGFEEWNTSRRGSGSSNGSGHGSFGLSCRHMEPPGVSMLAARV